MTSESTHSARHLNTTLLLRRASWLHTHTIRSLISCYYAISRSCVIINLSGIFLPFSQESRCDRTLSLSAMGAKKTNGSYIVLVLFVCYKTLRVFGFGFSPASFSHSRPMIPQYRSHDGERATNESYARRSERGIGGATG